MATGVLGTADSHASIGSNANFIPELWSDDVIAGYKKNLIIANLVTKINHVGKKGDTLHIPAPTRGVAAVKATETQVTVQANSESKIDITIGTHYEYSRIIEDILAVQAIDSFRGFYTDDAGYALATKVDVDLFALAEGLNGGTVGGTGSSSYENAVIGGDGTTTYQQESSNSSTLTDAGIRKMIQTLDDSDVPQTERYLVIPPVERNTLMGLPRFTEQAFTGEVGPGNTIRNGMIGDIYGIQVYVTTNCPAPNTGDRIGMLFHKDAFVFVEQMSVRTQTQYLQQWLGDLFTADTIYGVGELRNDAGIAFAVDA